MEKVLFPNTLKRIEAFAFAECDSLEYVEIPENVTVGECAFGKCKSLKKVRVGRGCNIHENAFLCCNKNIKIEMDE